MSRHDDATSFGHIRDYAREAVEFAGSRSRGDLDTDRMLELSLTRLIEIVGEAANRVSEETRARYPEIPWPQIVGMRNRIIHAYEHVDLNILWDTVTLELPSLIEQVERILEQWSDAD